MRFRVSVSDCAFESMVLSSIEGFALGDDSKLPRKVGAQAVEVIGPLWGSVSRSRSETRIQIERAVVSLTSERKYDECGMPDATQRLHADVMSVIAPAMTLLGDFHSHPWKGGVDEVHEEDGFDFTDEDFAAFQDDNLAWERGGGNPVILVLAVCRMKRLIGRPAKQLRSDLWTFYVGKYRCWIAVSVGYGDRQHTVADDKRIDFQLGESVFQGFRGAT